MKSLARFTRDRRGATAILVALTMPVMIGFAAMGVDYGYFLLDKQKLQSSADLAALSGASAGQGMEKATAFKIIAANGEAPENFDVTTGAVVQNSDGTSRFVAGASGGAVRVHARRPTQVFFAQMFLPKTPVIDVASVASSVPVVSMAIGSKLVSLNDGLVRDITTKLFGTSVDASFLGYDGVWRSTIETNAFLTALAGLLGDTTATVGSLVAKEVSLHLVVKAAILVLQQDGQVQTASLLTQMNTTLARADVTVKLGEILALPQDVLNLQVGTPSTYLTANFALANLLMGAIQPNGKATVVQNEIDVPPFGKADVEVMIGEGMVRALGQGIGSGGLGVQTAQVRARLKLHSAPLPLTGAPRADFPLELVIAAGEAKVVSTHCDADPAKRSVTLDVLPGAVRLELGDQSQPLQDTGVLPSGKSTPVFQALGLKVLASAAWTARRPTPQRVTFRGSQIGDGTIQTVSSTQMASTFVVDLAKSVKLDVSAGGHTIGMANAQAVALVKMALQTMAVPMDTLVDAILQVAGVRIGRVDVRVDDLVCRAPRIAV